jgi:hypothetical protein
MGRIHVELVAGIVLVWYSTSGTRAHVDRHRCQLAMPSVRIWSFMHPAWCGRAGMLALACVILRMQRYIQLRQLKRYGPRSTRGAHGLDIRCKFVWTLNITLHLPHPRVIDHANHRAQVQDGDCSRVCANDHGGTRDCT